MFAAFSVQIVNDDKNISGTIKFIQNGEESRLKVSGTISGLTEGPHGFHVHQNPELGNNCMDAGPHFNPNEVF